MEITETTEEWWSRTLEPELGIIKVHAIPAPKDADEFERRLGLAIAEPGSTGALVERVKNLGREHGYTPTASVEGDSEQVWIVTLRK